MKTSAEPPTDKPSSSTFSRVVKYISVRAIVIALMVSVGIFLAIVIINYGGYIDKIHQAEIDESLNYISLSMPGATIEQVQQATEKIRWAMEEAYGLHKPFLLRCVNWWYQTITFHWGSVYQMGIQAFGGGLVPVTQIVLERLPYTLLLAGATNIILFFASIFVALNLAKKYGSIFDRLIVALSPLSSIPNWVYGIILTFIFAGELHILPFNGLYDTFPPATKWGYIPIVAKHMVLPVTAIFLGMFFSAVYTWRTFFLIHSGEDYLEMARAKGLPDRTIERRYVLRPTMPYLITSFTILIITFWQGIIVLEVFFDWPGLGQLFMNAISSRSIAITTGVVTTFALLLAISIFFLDIIYVLVDPRIKIGGNSQTVRPITRSYGISRSLSSLWGFWRSQGLWQGSVSAVRNALDWLIDRYVQAYNNRRQSRLWPSALSLAGARSKKPANHNCPHLQVENYRLQRFDSAGGRAWCSVHGRPERIAAAYQTRVCQVAAHRRCPRLVQSARGKAIINPSGGLYSTLRELTRFPAAFVGVAIILGLVGLSIYAVIAIPYDQAVHAWLPQTAEKYQTPQNALPEWVNYFRKDPLPPTIDLDSTKGAAAKTITSDAKGITSDVITYTVNFPYADYPTDMLITFNGQYIKKPFVSLIWTTPDGRVFNLGDFSVVSTQRYLASTDIPAKYLAGYAVQRQGLGLAGIGGYPATMILFHDPSGPKDSSPLKGNYTLRIDATLFEPGSNLDAELILYGKVYGLAGTDNLRRDLMVPLLWGTPTALAFGLFGALATGVLSMMIAAVGVWFGGWVDGIIQRLTEVNMILPTLPIAIMIYVLYSQSIWFILCVIILFSIFGSSIKTYRAAILQVKDLPYVEAAQAYGASNWRLIRYYLVPRIIPLLIPQLVILVPSYVFFEATLAYLGVADPALPTWGKIVLSGLGGAYQGYYYQVLEPVAMLILTALAFAVVGFALDSILNPRLRRM